MAMASVHLRGIIVIMDVDGQRREPWRFKLVVAEMNPLNWQAILTNEFFNYDSRWFMHLTP
jgi:hypothetical protein